jgi:FkbM family methyltransferase
MMTKNVNFISLIKPLVELFPKVAAIYRGMRDQMDAMKPALITPWGFKLSGNAAMAKGIFEPEETRLIQNLLNDVDILVNIGANIGYYCCHAMNIGKYVIAFEPIHRNLQHLCRNIKINGWTDTEIYPIALSDHVGIVEMYGADTGASMIKGWAGIPENYVTFVPSSTLDIVLKNRLTGKKLLILVDIEGSEYLMLQGAIEILNKTPKPIWIIEITTTDNQPESVEINPNFKKTFDVFFQNGYQAFTADDNMRLVTTNDIDMVLAGKSKLGVHNFIFKEAKAAL